MTSQPENFIINSDYATLKNDSIAVTATVSVPASVAVGTNGTLEYHTDISAGTAGASVRCRIRSSKFGSRWMATPQMSYSRLGSAGPYSLVAFVYVVSPGVIRCSVNMQNPSGVPMTTEAGVETIDFSVSTFIPPFA
jgi:hypothetical protein